MLKRLKTTLRNLISSGPFWNMMGSGMVAANTVFLTMLVSRFADLATVGAFTLALTTSQILYTLGLFGANDLQMTDYRHTYRFAHYFHVRVFSTLLSVLCCAVAIAVMRFSGAGRLYTWLLTAYMMVNAIAELYQSMFFQNGRLDLSGKALFFRYFLSTVGFFAALLAGASIAVSCVAMLAVNILATVWWDLRLAGKYRDSGYGFEWEPCLRLARAAFPLCLGMLCSLILVNCPKYIIDATLNDEAQGLYGLLFMPTYAINLISTFVYRPFFPRYSRLLEEDKRGFRRLLLSQVAMIIGVAAAGAAMIWLVGVPFMRLLFGRDLGGQQGLMALFMLSGGVMAINQLLYYIMVILRRQRVVPVIYLVGTLLAVGVGIWLIPRLELTGAWAAFTVGQVMLAVGFTTVLIRNG
ncbi:MAG: hypothetical protein IJ119_05310 [Clostridia bacterium]|nr:hypothetical protein [Clostridia bacterium]